MKKFYEIPELELIESTTIVATSNFNSHDNLNDYGDGDGDNADDLFGN